MSSGPAVRIAAAGDIHVGADSAGALRPQFERLAQQADMLLMAGDLTRHGEAAEAAVLAGELADMPVPVVAVLGNHDYHLEEQDGVAAALRDVGVRVLDGESTTIHIDGVSVGIVGVKGFGGGFAGACGSHFGEPEMKAFIGHTRGIAAQLSGLLRDMDTDLRVVLMHYAPVEGTLSGERLEIYPFLGSYLLGEAIDAAGGADVVFHGHAHAGVEKGATPGGTIVRNVAQHVLRKAYSVYTLHAGSSRARARARTGEDDAAAPDPADRRGRGPRHAGAGAAGRRTLNGCEDAWSLAWRNRVAALAGAGTIVECRRGLRSSHPSS